MPASYEPKDLRNIALVGHGSSGKTTLAESMLFHLKLTTRLGSVDEGNSNLDYAPDERERKFSIDPAMCYFNMNGKEFNLIDTPGYIDFLHKSLISMNVVETALVTVSATTGVELNTRKVWAEAERLGLARFVVITKMDGENINVPALLQSLKDDLGAECLPLNLPVGTGGNFSGVVSCLTVPDSVPDGVEGSVEDANNRLLEGVVETDEELMMRYLDGEEISQEELETCLATAVREGKIAPVLFVSAAKGIGVQELLDTLCALAPSPVDVPPRKAKKGEEEEVELTPDPSGPFVGFVYRIVTDPFVGKLSFVRVFSGTLKSDGSFAIARTRKTERVTQLCRLFGKEQRQVDSAGPGDFVAIPKLDAVIYEDTLCQPGNIVTCPPVELPRPMVSLAVEPKSRDDEQRINASLARLAEEDPSFIVQREAQTNELVITGTSPLHLDIMLKRLASRFHVEVATKPPKIPYHETVTVPAEGHHRHKKQTGGRGQYGEVYIKLEPMERGEGFEFVDEIVGGVVPNQYIPAVEKGIREVLQRGILAGFPIHDVRVRLYDGSYHPVDSSEASFKIAGAKAFQEAFLKAKPVLLEPIVHMEITIPSDYMGQITGDLNQRRGRILGMDAVGDMQVVKAQIPLSEVLQYSTELRSMTGGAGSYTLEFSHYDVVPQHIAEQVIAQHKREQEEAE